MGSALLESQILDAATRVSSATVGSSRGSSGSRSIDTEWEKMRGKVARAVVADPNLVMYFAFLASNRACALAKKAALQASEMVVSVEGWKYEQTPAAEPSRLNQALASCATREAITAEDVARLSSEVSTYVGTELVPRISKGQRLQVKSAAAIGAYRSSRDGLAETWRKLHSALDATVIGRSFSNDAIRNVAVRVPLDALSATAGALDQERLVEFTVQIAAAGAGVEAMGRAVNLKYRLRTVVETLPYAVDVVETLDDGVVSAITLSVAPVKLGIRSGDTVSTPAGGTATVLTVTDSGVTLGSSTIESTASGVDIVSTAYVQWEALVASLKAVFFSVPTVDALLSEVRRREERSAARIRALMEYLYKIAVVLDAPSTDATSALGRVGGVAYAYAGTPAAQLLAEFSPTFGEKTRQAGDRMLRDLENGGFDYAVEMLYRGEIDELMTAPASQVSRTGRLDDAAATLATFTGYALGT